MLPYFKKSEDVRIPELQRSSYHGTGGYLSVEELRYQSMITQTLLNAGQELGYNIVDINGASQVGFTKTHGTLRNGLRCSTAKGFLRPAKNRPNLHISLHSHVVKILINNATKTAEGIQFQKHERTLRTIKARKEVIISAGSIKTPQVYTNSLKFRVTLRSIYWHICENFNNYLAPAPHAFRNRTE